MMEGKKTYLKNVPKEQPRRKRSIRGYNRISRQRNKMIILRKSQVDEAEEEKKKQWHQFGNSDLIQSTNFNHRW